MLKPIILGVAVAGTLFLSGCGEDNATEPRINFVTMMNATQNTISSKIADLGTKDIATKSSRAEEINTVGEAPNVSYDSSHKKTISKNDGFSGYIATACNSDGFLYHTGSFGELRIVNTSSKSITASVDNKNITVASCSIEKTGVKVDKDSITIKINGTTNTIDPNGETVWDSVIFDDDSFKNFAIKSFKL